MDLRKRLMVEPGRRVKLARWAPDDTDGYADKAQARQRTAENLERLDKLQYLLYAENRRALLVILQGMDASGKDGTIRHVMRGLNPQGCAVTSFKAPSLEELSHDFLWRIHKAVPRRGQIGIFNRSHYEDVLVVRVRKLAPKAVWSTRYDQINAFEKVLTDNDVHILKFFLHITREEQLSRLKDRLDDPDKQWKVNPVDFEERKYWDRYVEAYEDALSRCSTEHAPWFVVPANHKWYRDLVVSRIIVETLESLKMKFPKPAFDLSKIKIE